MHQWFKWIKQRSAHQTRLAVAFDELGFSYALVDNSQVKPFVRDCGFINTSNEAQTLKELKSLCLTHHFEDLQCSLVLAPDKYVFFLIDAPDVGVGDLSDSLRWRMKDYLDYPVEEALFDYIELPRSKFLDKKMVYQIASKRSVVEKQVGLMQAAGFNVDIIDTPEFAIKNIAKLLEENEQGEAFVKLHPLQSKIVLVRKNDLYLMRNIDVDISSVFDKSSLNLSLEEKAKVRELVDELALEIQRSLDYCTSVLKQSPAQSLVFSPVGFACEDFLTEMRTVLGFPVKMLDCSDYIDFYEDFPLEKQARCFAALGAALRVGVDHGD